MQKYLDIAIEVLTLEASELIACSKRLGEEFERAVETIYDLEGKLVIIGVGKSGLVGAKIAATMASTGTPSFFYPSNRSYAR